MQASSSQVTVIGAGIGGLTAGALLAKRGYDVKIYDQAYVAGGCASTFKRRGFTFDVGATQVAGLEPGGIHYQIFQELEIDIPEFTPCDPACAVYLPGESEPISVWRDPQQWKAEREKQFPGSDRLWKTLNQLFQANWKFQSRDPIIPPRNLWDIRKMVAAVRPDTLITVPYIFSTVGDLLKKYGLDGDRRLKTFLDLQLKLYSQVGADETALLYAATALGISQAPFGLAHLQGSMQVLADVLVQSIQDNGGEVHLQHRVESIQVEGKEAKAIALRNLRTDETWEEPIHCLVTNVTVQDLVGLMGPKGPQSYSQRVKKLTKPSGAFVLYLGVKADAIPENCAPHLQFLYDYDGPIGENNSLFISVSKQGDGRAPEGHSTIVASSFTAADRWSQTTNYQDLKEEFTHTAIKQLGQFFDLRPEHIVHQEAGTPRTFARFTGRAEGIVGGLGQRRLTFGPFGFSTRTPLKNLWLVGDSTHPGEGTAGVSYSAWSATQQIEVSGILS